MDEQLFVFNRLKDIHLNNYQLTKEISFKVNIHCSFSFELEFHLNLVVSVSDDGFAEGICKENHGWIPMNCLQDISMDERVVLSRDQLTALILTNEQFHPRTIVLQKGKKGFGFVLRGSRSSIFISFFLLCFSIEQILN